MPADSQSSLPFIDIIGIRSPQIEVVDVAIADVVADDQPIADVLIGPAITDPVSGASTVVATAKLQCICRRLVGCMRLHHNQTRNGIGTVKGPLGASQDLDLLNV